MSRMIILVGLPGSGKSTLAKEFPDFGYVNQDQIGNRHDCIEWTKKYLKEGKPVIIDRTNINKEQRNYFIQVAKEYNIPVSCIFLDFSVVECIERIKGRTHHETLPSSTPIEKVEGIVSRFSRTLEKPTYDEGYEKIIVFNNFNEFSSFSNWVPLNFY